MISTSHRCVFVHIPKTAGQSVEQVFLDALGLDWQSRGALLLRRNRNPALGPPRLAHLLARDYVRRGYLSSEEFARYFRFAFVRNPWDRVVSFYKYIGRPGECSFREFVLDRLPGRLWGRMHWFVRPQVDYLFDEGQSLVDFVGRFESLDSDFSVVAERLGLPDDRVPMVNRSEGRHGMLTAISRQWLTALSPASAAFGNFSGRPLSQHRRWADYYDDQTWQRVAELYADDINQLGYTTSDATNPGIGSTMPSGEIATH